MQELTRRKIPFISPPTKPMRAIKKEKLSSLILHASVGIASLSVISFILYKILIAKEEMNLDRFLKLVIATIIGAIDLFLSLTTNEADD